MNQQSPDATVDAGSMAAADAIHAAMRFLRVMRYRKSYIVASLAVAGLLGALYYFTATRIYRSIRVAPGVADRQRCLERDHEFRRSGRQFHSDLRETVLERRRVGGRHLRNSPRSLPRPGWISPACHVRNG